MNAPKRFFLASLLLLSACASRAQFAPSRLTEGFPPRTPPDAIELFRSALPNKRFREIGAVHACCAYDPNDMIVLLRKQAAESGGDALTNVEISPEGGVSASVIRYE